MAKHLSKYIYSNILAQKYTVSQIKITQNTVCKYVHIDLHILYFVIQYIK